MSRPIVLPTLPAYLQQDLSHMTWSEMALSAKDYARAAVEADRAGIVVTDEDVDAALRAFNDSDGDYGGCINAALKSFAARLRGDKP